jgi:DNA-binding XRE family transcriptional regulator
MAGTPTTVAEKIFLARRRLGEDQSTFGDRFHVKQWTVSHWEKETMQPSPEHILELRQLFREMFGDEDEEQVETHAHQLFLPFDQPVNFEFRVARHTADSVRFAVQIKRKAS